MDTDGDTDNHIENNEPLERYLRFVKNIYERMHRDNSWPWVVDPEGWARTEAEIKAKQKVAKTEKFDSPFG